LPDHDMFGKSPALSAVILVGLALICSLILAFHYVPLFDLPNHLARHYLESLQLAGRPLPPNYQIVYGIMPNQGADFVLPPLILLSSPLLACKVFLIASILLFWLGEAVYLRTHAEGCSTSWLAATALMVPWVLNSPFFWGFLNYYSGMGLSFLLIGLNDRLGSRPRLGLLTAIGHAGLLCLLFLWHLFPWAIYVVITCVDALVETLACNESRSNQGRFRPFYRSIMLLPSIGLFLIFLIGQTRSISPASSFAWGGMGRKLTYWLVSFRGYDARIDSLALLTWIASIVLGLDMARLKLNLGSRALWRLVAIVACFIVLPAELGIGSATEADLRVLPVLLLCAVALLVPVGVKRMRVFTSLLAACLLLRICSIAFAWGGISGRLSDESGVFAHLRRGDRVLPIIMVEGNVKEYPEQHLAAYAVFESHAYIPSLDIHYPTTLVIRERGCERRLLGVEGRAHLDPRDLIGCYDFVLVLNPLDRPLTAYQDFRVVARSGHAVLLAVPKESGKAQGNTVLSWEEGSRVSQTVARD
jgi:hypothetical protein